MLKALEELRPLERSFSSIIQFHLNTLVPLVPARVTVTQFDILILQHLFYLQQRLPQSGILIQISAFNQSILTATKT